MQTNTISAGYIAAFQFREATNATKKESHETNSEFRFGSSQGISSVEEYGDPKPYTRCITANIWSSSIGEDGLSLLSAGKDRISDTVVTNKSEYTDPTSGQKVPVSIAYITSYSDDGISCRKEIRDGDEESGRELWTLQYNSPDDHSKVRELLNGFADDDRLTFATQKVFWEDYLGGEMDVEAFKDYYSETKNGIIDFEGRLADGKALRDIVSEPYAEYFNNQSFIGHVYTEQEMWDNWYARIEASQKASTTVRTGIEPPTETIITKSNKMETAGDDAKEEFRRLLSNNPLWHWRDGVFGYNAEVYKSEDRESEYIVRLHYDNGREEERVVDTDKVNASSCSIVDLQVKMLRLQDEGKISQEDYMMDMVIAHFNMDHQYPNADENTIVDFRDIFEKQLELEMRNGGNEKHIAGWLNLLSYL